MRVLLVQYKPVGHNLNKNIQKFRRILRKYKDESIDLVVFPEYALSGGFPYGKFDELALNIDQKKNLDILNLLKNLAKKYEVNLIPGSFLVKELNNYYNRAILINRYGEIKLMHNKRKLWAAEKRFLKAGTETNLVKIDDFGSIGVQICADLNDPNLSNCYKKASLIVNVALWSEEDRFVYRKYVPPYIEKTTVEVLSKARSLENQAYFIFVNYAGRIVTKASTGRRYVTTSIGNSMVVNPFGEIIAKTSTNKEEFLLVDIK